MSETGLFVSGEVFASTATPAPDNAVIYEPNYPLWSNGSRKLRHLVLPDSADVDTTDPSAWRFPAGTLAFKTFFFARSESDTSERPIETRVIRVAERGLEYAAYAWNAAGTEASLLLSDAPHTVSAFTFDGEALEHQVPSQFECRNCHESSPAQLLGLNTNQLAASRAEVELLERGWLTAELPAQARALVTGAAEARAVLGYFVGNCVHCHNGWNGPNSAFSLAPEDALDHLVDRPTTGSASIAGIRVVPGNPAESVLLSAMLANVTGIEAQPERAKAMPPLGVQLVDWTAIAAIETWIESLAPDDREGSGAE